MKVLLVAQTVAPPGFGGVPLVTRNLARALASAGVATAVMVVGGSAIAGFRERQQDGLSIYEIPSFDLSWVSLRSLLDAAERRQVAGVREILRRFEPQVVHVNSLFRMSPRIPKVCALVAPVVVREFCFPEDICIRENLLRPDGSVCDGPESVAKCTACYFEGYPEPSALPRLAKKVMVPWLISRHRRYVKAVYETALAGAIFPSRGFRDIVKRYLSFRSDAVIPHGIERSPESPDYPGSTSGVRVVFLGPLFRAKGIDVALKAAEALLKANGSATFRVHGPLCDAEFSPWMARLESTFPGRFRYCGPYQPHDLPHIMVETDVGVVPSTLETYSLVLREFLAYAKPVLATRFWGDDVVQDGWNGYRIPVGDDAALAERLLALCADPGHLAALTDGARHTHIPTVDEERDQILAYYASLLTGREARTPK